jgi:hypothetical protein
LDDVIDRQLRFAPFNGRQADIDPESMSQLGAFASILRDQRRLPSAQRSEPLHQLHRLQARMPVLADDVS